MNRTDTLNCVLRHGRELAEKLIVDLNLDRDEYEHDLFYGNPDAALRDILFDLDEKGAKLSQSSFDEIIGVIEGVRGRIEANEKRRRYGNVVAK